MSIPSMEKVTLAREYRVAKWFQEGVEALASDAQAFRIDEMAAVLGWEATARIFAIRDLARGPKPGAVVPTILASQLSCIGCRTSSPSPGVPYASCCSGFRHETRYGGVGYVQGYFLAGAVTPAPLTSEEIRKSVLELFDVELKALGRH
jgi:hypothetical protein